MFLYKYRNGTIRDIEALMNNQFYASSIESLNDIQEGKIKGNDFEINFFDLLAKNISSKYDICIKKNLENFINIYKKSGVYSLSKSYKNELLWAYYADSHKGFCIEYDECILKQYPVNEDNFFNVKYSADIPVIDFKAMLDIDILKTGLVAKSLSWKHEEEIRILTPSIGMYNYFARAVKSIYFGFRASDNMIKIVMAVLRGRGIKYFKMTHKKDLFELTKYEIDDIFKDESIYKNKVNKFVPYLDKNEIQFEDLIKKAIIIVEQEPLCEEILDISKSNNKSTKDNPVFFVSYKNETKNIYARKYFISKKEIEDCFI